MSLYKKVVEARNRFHVSARLQALACLAVFVLPTFALFSLAQSAAQSGDPQQFAVGVSITRELSGGQSHSYQAPLAKGQYLQISVDQRGCDVAVSLFGPDGALQAESDFDSDLRGQEILSWVTKAACDCKLEVRSKSKTAGRYVLKIEALREATPQDADRIAAYRSQMEARKLQSQQTAEAMRHAAGKYEAALVAWKNLGDQAGQAATLLDSGAIYFDLADSKKSLAAWTESLALFRATGRRTEEAMALSNLGLLNYARGEKEKALEQYNQALTLHRAEGDRFWEAETLNRIGWVYNALDERRRAIEHHNLALPMRREVGDRVGEAVTLNDLGRAYDDLGEKQRAVEFFEQALRLSPPDERPEGASQILIRLGAVHDSTGESQKALDAYGQALRLLEKTENRRALAATLNNLGLAHTNLGDYGRAIEYYDRALTLCRELELRGGEATTLHNIGLVYRAAGDFHKAIDYQNQALAIHKSINSRSGQALDLQALGIAHYALGDERRALEFYDQTLVLRRALNDRRGVAMTLTSIGVAWAAMGEAQKAHDYLSQSLPLHRAVANLEGEAEALLDLARVKYDLGAAAEARTLLDQSLQLTDSIRAKAPGQELRASYFAAAQRRYELGIDLLMRMQRDGPSSGYDASALQLSERARARGLIDLLTEAGADIRQGVDAELLAQERALQQQLNTRAEAQTRLLSGNHTVAQAAVIAKEVADLTAKLEEAETQIRTTSPRYAALAQPQPLSVAEIQRLLDDDTLLLEYALGEKRSYLWAVTTKTVISYPLPPRAEIEGAARKVYDLLSARPKRGDPLNPQFTLQAESLSRMLLGPAASQIGQSGQSVKTRLVFVAPGVLSYLPFAALPFPADVKSPAGNYLPLVATHEIVNLPSASVLSVIRRETAGRKPPNRTIAVLADPVFGVDDQRVTAAKNKSGSAETLSEVAAETSALTRAIKTVNPSSRQIGGQPNGRTGARTGLARLAFSRQEADAILAFAMRGTGMKATDFNASRATAMSPELSQYRILHFATHGLLNNENPELSGLILSLVDENGRAEDGFLRLHEVFNLKLNADLVVLSACETGLGKDIKGEGVIGLTRGFMYAGAPSVVTSLWNVDDLVTAELMKLFYRGMLKDGLRPAAALRAAQDELSRQKRWASPYFWAAFVLQGEWK
ncbi:MAG TPA: CHAT domain-containing protein [Blastocatellia bacterium]|nr:CHAT domain-containing protein [Blastocatellia bacterium]